MVALNPLAEVIAAAEAATMGSVTRQGRARQLFVQLARAVGWRNNVQLATAAQVDVRTIQRLALRKDPALLAPGLRCLGDVRCRAKPRETSPDATPGRTWVAMSPTTSPLTTLPGP